MIHTFGPDDARDTFLSLNRSMHFGFHIALTIWRKIQELIWDLFMAILCSYIFANRAMPNEQSPQTVGLSLFWFNHIVAANKC